MEPFVPGDKESSGLPVAACASGSVDSAVPLNATVMLSLEDIVGHRLRVPGLTAGSSVPQVELREAPGMSGVLVGDAGMNEDDEEWGTIAAAVLGEGSFRRPVDAG